QLGGDRAKGRRELRDFEVLERGAEQIEEPLAADQPALQGDVHEAPDFAPREPGHPGFELIELAGRVYRANQRADRGATNEIRLDAALFQRANRADVRPAARAARAERESDTGFACQGAASLPGVNRF